jgi:hypothetical protein
MTGAWRPGDAASGDDARRLVADQIEQHSAGLHAALAKFDRQSAFSAWFETIRAVEELINLPRFGLKEPWLWEALLDLPVDMTRARSDHVRSGTIAGADERTLDARGSQPKTLCQRRDLAGIMDAAALEEPKDAAVVQS